MNLNYVQKIILGIFTFLPFILFPIFVWQMLHSVGYTILVGDHQSDEQLIMPLLSFVIPIIFTAFGALALTIFYVAHAVLNKTLGGSEQVLWILLFIFFGLFAFPAYWVMRIWNNPNKS
jgi:hypothetical protein